MMLQASKEHTALAAITQELGSLKETARIRYKAELLGVFGSYARGEQHEGSDVDILVRFDRGATLFDMVGLEYFLEEALGLKPDIVSEKSIKPRLRQSVLNELIPL